MSSMIRKVTLHWKLEANERPVDMEWNKAEKRWQPMVFDDDDDYSDAAEGEAVVPNSPVSSTSSTTTTETTTASFAVIGEGSQEDRGSVIDWTRCHRRCGKCPGCRMEDCGTCAKCRLKVKFGGQGSRGACLNRPCERSKATTTTTTARTGKKRPPPAAAAAPADNDEPSLPEPTTLILKKGDRVYCRWPENDAWYWGNVTAAYKHRGKPQYRVVYDDGDKRTHVPVADMFTEADYYRLNPAKKKAKKVKDVVSLSSASTSSMATSSMATSRSSTSTTSSNPPPFRQIDVAPRAAVTGGAITKKNHVAPSQQQPARPTLGGSGHMLAGSAAPTRDTSLTPNTAVLSPPHHHHRYQGGGSLSHRCGKDNKSPSCDSTLDIDSRVWARYSENKRYYWGKITAKTGEGKFTKYSVLFEDGDTEHDIPREYVYSENQYFGRPKLNTTADICHQCALCLKEDCGSCEACDANRQSTQTSKYCCLFKTCMAMDIEKKALSIPDLPDWKFYFDNEPSSTTYVPLHPKLAGLRIIPPLGSRKIYGSLEAAVKGHALSEAVATNAAEQLYEKLLGLQIRVPVATHELIGKRICRQWLDVTFRPKVLHGRIISCARYYFTSDHLSFEVEYDEECRALIDSARGFDAPVMKVEEVSQILAWGGYALFQEKASLPGGGTQAAETPPPHLKWLLPDMIHRDLLPAAVASNGKQRPRLSIIFRGFRLVLEARQSDIPNAGLGVFLTCFATSAFMHDTSQDYFVLPAGELLDIGMYAPLRKEDLKSGGVLVLKNFIHNYAAEVYGFDISGPEKGKKIFDITDNLTSELHEDAIQNVPAFVNETDGEAIPTIHAMHDPHGSVHYLLGHNHPDHRPFRIRLGKQIEVKIDYGNAYERVRVRKQYSRLDDSERHKVEASIQQDDSETLSDINEWSVAEVEENVVFLNSLKFTQPSIAAGRSLIAATMLLHRLNEVQKEFSKVSQELAAVDSYCDNGFSTMDEKKVVERATAVVLQLLGLWDNEDVKLEDFFRSSDDFVYYLAKAVEIPAATAKQLNGGAIRKKIQALCRIH